MINTVDLLGADKEEQGSEEVRKELAEISHYCQSYKLKVKKLPQTGHVLNEKCWSIVSKTLRFVTGGNGYFKRLVDS
jgi:hypothetical protein